jgi:hypothetical protein
LSPRDWAVLQSVATLRLATSRHLEAPHFTDSPSPLTAARKCRRVLRRLTDRGLLRRLERTIGGLHAGSAAFIYAVTGTGQRLLSAPDSRARRAEPSLPFVAHTLAIADLYVAVHAVVATGTCDLLAIQTEPTCWRSWTGLGGEQLRLRPDLYVAVGVGDDEVRHFVEVDLGSEHRPALVRKAQAYQAYYDSGVEQDREGVFPEVAWLVPDTARGRLLKRAFAQQRDLTPGLFRVLTLEDGAGALTI